MQAQRACIDVVAAQLGALNGPVLELGFGNGRTYDHLRACFPGHAIFVFDLSVAAHPDCIPPTQYLRLGDFRATVPAYATENQPAAAFIHADIGSGDEQASAQLAAELAPACVRILAPGGYLACDQPLVHRELAPLPLPSGVHAGRYNLYRRLA